MDVAAEYKQRYDEYLVTMAKGLEGLVMDHLQGQQRIDRISARAKTPTSFAAKAAKLASDGAPKYGDPLTEIQDQLGVRVTVFYLGDVEPVRVVMNRYFTHIEERELLPESSWAFGYFGWHAVMATPTDVVPRDVELSDAPRFFELQIKTLFQHAWSEANHDLGYKAASALSNEQQRQLAFAAAQGWGADRAFEQLRAELSEPAT